jgi:hypothetical protein
MPRFRRGRQSMQSDQLARTDGKYASVGPALLAEFVLIVSPAQLTRLGHGKGQADYCRSSFDDADAMATELRELAMAGSAVLETQGIGLERC